MNPARSVYRGSIWRLRLLATVFAAVGQLGISGMSVMLARNESSSAPHAERKGISLHHAHNEATCAACAVSSFQATASDRVVPVTTEGASRLVLARCLAHRVTGPELLPNSCRAPPREV